MSGCQATDADVNGTESRATFRRIFAQLALDPPLLPSKTSKLTDPVLQPSVEDTLPEDSLPEALPEALLQPRFLIGREMSPLAANQPIEWVHFQ